MSFFNTIRGLGRSTRKSKKEYEQQGILNNSQLSTLPVRRNVNSGRNSPLRQRASMILFAPLSPKKKALQTRQPQRDGKPPTNEDLPMFLCQPYVRTALVKGSFKTIVQLPKYVDYREWLALNLFEMYAHLNLFYGVIAEYVTPEKYPTMNAGPNFNYLWKDSSGNNINLPACQYISYVLTWISSKINDQSVFPTKNGAAFSPSFIKDCKNITRQMIKIFAHIYHNHFEKIVHLSLEAHWNSFFAHFISFCNEFSLLDRAEMSPLLPLIESFEEQGKII